MSWVETLDSGRYRAVYRDDLGKRRSKTFTRKRDARDWLASERTDRARGQWVDPRGGEMLFSEWAEQWMAVRTVRRTTAAGDRSRYRNQLGPAFGAVPLKDITPLRVKAFVAELATRRSPATVRHAHAMLSSILGDAVVEGLLLTNPCARTKLPKTVPYRAVFLDPEQIGALADAVDPHYRTLVLTAAGTGMRWGELAGLSRTSVDLLHARLMIDRTLEQVDGAFTFGQPKSRTSRRVVTLSPALVQLLTTHFEGSKQDLVFSSPQGEPMCRHNFNNRIWQPGVTRAGLEPRPRFHDLRHSHVALLIAAGVPIKAIQERLGHASIVMTMDRYGHLLPRVDAELLKAIDDGLREVL